MRRTLSVPLDFQEALRGRCLHGPLRRRLADLLALWDTNKENCDEGFWQIKLTVARVGTEAEIDAAIAKLAAAPGGGLIVAGCLSFGPPRADRAVDGAAPVPRDLRPFYRPQADRCPSLCDIEFPLAAIVCPDDAATGSNATIMPA